MAYEATTVEVADVVTLIIDGTGSTGAWLLAVPADGDTVYVGGPNVTVETGFPLTAGGPALSDSETEANLYGVVATGTQDVHLLARGV